MRSRRSVLVCVLVGLLGVPAVGAGLAGGALAFSVDEHIALVPNSPSLNPVAALTMEAWFMLTVYDIPGGYCPVVEKPYVLHDSPFYQYSLGPGLDYKFRGSVDTPSMGVHYAYGDLACVVGEWHHFAASYDGTSFKIYGDGALENSIPMSGPISTFDTPLTIGTHLNHRYAIRGIIDEVRIWEVARTSDEIAASYNRQVDPSTPGLVGYWNFDEPSGQYVYDQSPFDNDGTLGMTSAMDIDDPIRVDSTAPIVPEPVVLSLLALGGLGLLRRRSAQVICRRK